MPRHSDDPSLCGGYGGAEGGTDGKKEQMPTNPIPPVAIWNLENIVRSPHRTQGGAPQKTSPDIYINKHLSYPLLKWFVAFAQKQGNSSST